MSKGRYVLEVVIPLIFEPKPLEEKDVDAMKQFLQAYIDNLWVDGGKLHRFVADYNAMIEKTPNYTAREHGIDVYEEK